MVRRALIPHLSTMPSSMEMPYDTRPAA
jgi:hypothetical protein